MVGKYILPLILGLLFLTIGIFTLPDYGINWDSPLRMMRGQAYLNFLLTGQKTFKTSAKIPPVLIKPNEFVSQNLANAIEVEGKTLFTSQERPLTVVSYKEAVAKGGKFSFYQSNYWNAGYFIKEDGAGHLTFPDLGSTLFNKIFWGTLGWFGDLESYQVFFVFIASIGVFITSLFAYELTGSYFVSFCAGIFLALFPVFFGDSHFNVKDPLVTTFSVGLVWSFWHFLLSRKIKWVILFFIFLGLGMGTKWNMLELIIIIPAWLFLIRKTDKFKSWFKIKRLFTISILGSLAVLLFLIITWPYSWDNPIGKLFAVFSFYKNFAIQGSAIQPSGFITVLGFNTYPIILFLTQTPDILLLLSFIALVKIRKNNPWKIKQFLLFWIGISVLKFTLPHAQFYAGYRQFMEITPAIAILGALGLQTIVSLIPFKLNQQFKNLTFAGLILIIMIAPIIHLHPNENVYFNSLVGGIKGADNRNLIDWTITDGNIYKQAAEWMNSHSEKNSNIAFISGSLFALSPLYLRDDISISPDHFSRFDREGEYILVLSDKGNINSFGFRYPKKFLNPVHTISVDGVPLLRIFKNDVADFKGKPNEIETKDFSWKIRPSIGAFPYIELFFDKEMPITRIKLNNIDKNCNATNWRIGNEAVAFYKFDNDKLVPESIYTQIDRNKLGEKSMEYLFEGEEAQAIRILPLDKSSCFINGVVSSISALSSSQ